jgi:hypothetical protein
MVNALQDRPASTLLVQPAPRRRSSTVVRLGGVALVAALAIAGAGKAADLLPSWGDLPQEVVVDRQRPALVLALADLAEYHAAQGTFQVVVDLERDTPYVPAVVKGERTTYLAVGAVDGLVDLRALGEGAVRTEGQTAVITLPRPRLGEAVVDLEQSRVVARDRGVLDRVSGAFGDSPTSERDVALLAQDKLEAAAADSDLLRRAEDNTRGALTGLARSFGYTDVRVEFTADAVA